MTEQERKEWLNKEIERCGAKILNSIPLVLQESEQSMRELQDKYIDEYAQILAREQAETNQQKQEVTTRVKKAIKSGKNLEYRIAKKLGGVVVGKSKAVKVEGKFIQIDLNRPPDVVTPLFSVECKAMKSVPKKLKNACNQSYRNCPTGLTPITVLYGKDDQDYYWVIKSPHFEELYGK